MSRKNTLRITNLVKKGFTLESIKRINKREKLKVSNKKITEKFVKFSSRDVLVKRFERARMNTKITNKYFQRLKTNRAFNVFVITVIIKVTNLKTGFSEESFFSVGYDNIMTKKKILKTIDDAIKELVRDSPLIEIEFVRIHSLFSKTGKF